MEITSDIDQHIRTHTTNTAEINRKSSRFQHSDRSLATAQRTLRSSTRAANAFRASRQVFLSGSLTYIAAIDTKTSTYESIVREDANKFSMTDSVERQQEANLTTLKTLKAYRALAQQEHDLHQEIGDLDAQVCLRQAPMSQLDIRCKEI